MLGHIEPPEDVAPRFVFLQNLGAATRAESFRYLPPVSTRSHYALAPSAASSSRCAQATHPFPCLANPAGEPRPISFNLKRHFPTANAANHNSPPRPPGLAATVR